MLLLCEKTHLSFIVDVGLSDHHLLTWLVSTPRSQQQQQQLQDVVQSHPWQSLDVEQLCAELAASPLCQAN